MNTVKIAIPSDQPGGLEAKVSGHFGHCDLYTIVEMDKDGIKSVATLPNLPHQVGGCLAPVQLLADQGVTKLLAGGMGMRPLMGFNQAGIEVYLAHGQLSVGSSVKSFCSGQLPVFSMESACGGSQGGCGHS